MTFISLYRRLVDSYLNKSPYCADNDKNNDSYSRSKFEETSNLGLSVDFSNQWKETWNFQKKYVYYFSPADFSKEDSSTVDSLYKFYLKTLHENNSRCKTDTNSFKEAKTSANKRSDQSLHDKTDDVQEKSPTDKYASCTVSERQIMVDFANQRSDSPLNHAFHTLHYYFIFPFHVSKMIFDVNSSETGYHSVRFQDESDLSIKSSDVDQYDIDIYSVDDQTFERFCLQEEENVEELPSDLLSTYTEFETKDMKKNGDYDQKYNLLTSEVYRPYYTLGDETEDNISTSDYCQSKYEDREPYSSFMDKYIKNVQTDGENELDATAYVRKFKSSFNLERYNFSFAKLLRKLATMKEMKLNDTGTERKADD